MAAEWADIAEAYDASFARLCAGAVPGLLAAAGAPSGRILDVGCGTGTAAFEAAALGWSTDAVDAEPSMVAFAEAAAPTHPGGDGIRFQVATLPHLPFAAETFDAVVANFCINHVAHPITALTALRDVLRPGGPIAATIWPWGAPSPMNVLWSHVYEASGVPPVQASRLPEGSDFERSEPGFAALLAAAGFTDVTTTRLHWRWSLPAADLWRGVEAGIALVGQTWRAADADGRARMHHAYLEKVAEVFGEGDVAFDAEAVLGRAVRG